MTTGDAAPAVPSVRDFYDGLYYSPIYAARHKICLNVGFHADKALESNATVALPPARAARKFHRAHKNDASQLALYRALLSLVPDKALAQELKPAIIDVGCGAGGGLCELQSLVPHARITGVDVSSQAIARARETWARFVTLVPDVKHARELTLLQQSVEKLKGVASHSIDLVCAVQTLQEVQQLPKALAELERVLKPGGFLLIADFIPQDARTDQVLHTILAPLAAEDGASPPAFEIVHETMASYNAALGCQQSSPALTKLITEHLPREFHDEMQTFFFVEHTRLYELLRRDQMGYRLVCLRKRELSTSVFDKLDHPNGVASVENEIDETSSNVDSDSEYDDDDDYTDSDEDDDDDEIFDDDLANYYAYKDVYPQLEVLKDNFDVIRDEMQAVLSSSSWPFWPEKHYAEGDNEWRVFPFCYTFPAHDASKTAWVPPTCALCPRTVEILKRIPGIRTALFSKLGPGTTLTPHRGWADLSNHILRCHLGLVVPTFEDGQPCCSMVVGGERGAHRERELLVFDDSKLHFAYNKHADATRVILIVDLYRPDHLPRGRATGGHSDELDEFIDTFGKQTL